MNKAKILVAGYGSWAKAAVNPAARIVQHLQAEPLQDHNVVAVEMPVDASELYGRVERMLLQERPDAWIGIGLAAGATAIRAEMIGINWLHTEVPDAAGNHFHERPIMEGGAAAFNATLPNAEIVQAIRAAGIPALVSYSAGTHLCNQMLYLTAHLIEKHSLKALCGFLHVPYATDQIAVPDEAGQVQPSMAIDMMCTAVMQAIACVQATLSGVSSAK